MPNDRAGQMKLTVLIATIEITFGSLAGATDM